MLRRNSRYDNKELKMDYFIECVKEIYLIV